MAILDRNFNLSQRMVQELGRSIICGDYSSEGLPTEAELCEKFGVSRSAVREAVKMLSAKGLVSSKPRQGISILAEEDWNIFDPDLLRWSLESHPSKRVLKEFLQMRIAIEPEACALAARYAEPSKIEAIEAALESMKAAEEGSEADIQADIDFHVSILYASNNRFYIRLRDFIQTALRVSISHTSPIKGNHFAVYEDHAKIFNAIKNRNPERAKNAMLLLIDEALTFVEESLGDQSRK
jgi:DNA-binding FadR family transcriptional regulator